MRWITALLALVCVLAGALFGALNPEAVSIDVYWRRLDVALGAALLLAMLAGAVLAGLALWLAVIWPLRRRLAAHERERMRRESADAGDASTSSAGALPPPSSAD